MYILTQAIENGVKKCFSADFYTPAIYRPQKLAEKHFLTPFSIAYVNIYRVPQKKGDFSFHQVLQLILPKLPINRHGGQKLSILACENNKPLNFKFYHIFFSFSKKSQFSEMRIFIFHFFSVHDIVKGTLAWNFDYIIYGTYRQYYTANFEPKIKSLT